MAIAEATTLDERKKLADKLFSRKRNVSFGIPAVILVGIDSSNTTRFKHRHRFG